MTTTKSFDSLLGRVEKIYDSGNRTQALYLLQEAHNRTVNLTIKDEMNYYTWCAGTCRKDLKNNDLYLQYADSILRLLENSGKSKELTNRHIQALNMKADAYFDKGLFNDAYNFYFLAKKLASENGDSCSLSQFSYSLGMALYKQQRYKDAASHFYEASNEIMHCKDEFVFFYRRQELLDNIGLCYFHAGLYDSAMQFYRQTIAFIDSNYLKYDKRESVYLSAIGVVDGNIADIYIKLENYDTAVSLLNKSIAINLQKGYANTDAVLEQLKLARVYFVTGKKQEIKPLLQQINAELDSLPDKHNQLSLDLMMWKYFDSNHDYIPAYNYLKAYELLNDSLSEDNLQLSGADAGDRINNLERQYQISVLNKHNQQEKIYLTIAIVLVLMAIIIICLILRNAKKSREHIRVLTGLNSKVNDQKEQLQIVNKELVNKDNEKSRILRSAAHDILNPLAAISGLTDMLITESVGFDQEQKEILNLIREACENSMYLCRDILEATTDEKRELPMEWIDIHKLLLNTTDLFAMQAARKKQQLVYKNDINKAEVFANKEKIGRAISNLINNAIKFSYENSVIYIGLKIVDNKIDISVKDSGTGIPEQNKPFIFDLFTKAKTVGTGGETPNGLGLSISAHIAKLHNGEIWFESEEGKGSVFHLTLPLSQSQHA